MDIGGLSLQGQKVLAALHKMHSEKSHSTAQKNVIVFSQQLPSLQVQESSRVQHGEEQMKYPSCFSHGTEEDTLLLHYSTHGRDNRNRSSNLDNPLETFVNNVARLEVHGSRSSQTDAMVLPFLGDTAKRTALKLQSSVFCASRTGYEEKENTLVGEERPFESFKIPNHFPFRSVLDHNKDLDSNAAVIGTATLTTSNSEEVYGEFPSVLMSSPDADNSSTYDAAHEHSKLNQFASSQKLAKRQNAPTLLKKATTCLEQHEVNRAIAQDTCIDKTNTENRTKKENIKNVLHKSKYYDKTYIKDFFKVRKAFGTTLAGSKFTKRLCKEKTDAFTKPHSPDVVTLLSDTSPMISENIENPAPKCCGNESIKNILKNATATFNVQCNEPKTANCLNLNVDNDTENTTAENPASSKSVNSDKTFLLSRVENKHTASNTEGVFKETNSCLEKGLTNSNLVENGSTCSPIVVHAQINKEASYMMRQFKSTESLKSNGKKNKKCVFQAPLNKYFKDTKETAEDKLKEVTINDVDESIIHNILLQLDTKGLLEIGFTILYREGFCQLNKPKELSKHAHCTPKALVLSITQNNSNSTDFHYFNTDTEHWPDKTIPRKFLMKILSGRCRKVCFDAQEMVVFLMDIFGFEKQDVLNWVLLDPMVGSWLLDPDQASYHFNDVCEKLGTEKKPTSRSRTSKIQACHLLQMLSTLTEKLYVKLQEHNLWKLFLETEMKVVPIIAAMEFRGICIDKAELKKMDVVLEEEICLLQQRAYEAAGKVFQLNSLQQLTKILFEELQLEKKANIKAKETLTRGTKSTSEPVLRKLQPFHALPGIILEYRHLQKIKSTYVEAILQHCKGSHIFTSWEQTSAATGRLTSSNPNLQAVPKQPVLLTKHKSLLLRIMYVPRSGYTFLAVDFQHIEFRIFAYLAQDEKLIEMLQQPEDIFMTLAKLWLGKMEETATFEDREKTKRIVYAVMYGAGAQKVAEFLHLNTADASNIISKFVSVFPVLNRFRNQVLVECRKQGFLRTIGGRIRKFPNISSDNNMSRSYAERQAMNFIIQGSAADLCKAAMIHTEQKLQDEPAHLLLQIHDELVWEVFDSHLTKAADIVKSTMENLPAFCGLKPVVPFPVVITTGKTWGEMKTYQQ